ncbi:MAG: hypothetical protein KF850_26110 [Labilithrix sp.]|nr:hypothetical protein [Labilithrix sp.]
MTIDLEPLDPELRALLARARRHDAGDPTFDDAACERLLARVEAKLQTTSATAAQGGLAAQLRSPAAMVVGCLAVTAAIATTMRSPLEAPLPPSAVAQTGPSIAAPLHAAPPDEPGERALVLPTVSVDELPSPAPSPTKRAPRAELATPSARATAYAPSPSGAPSAGTSSLDLAGELRLVDAARAAMSRRHHDEALRLLADHEASYPNGQLAQQRERLWIQALVETGDVAQARSRTTTFREQHPRGVLSAPLERALEGDETHEP